MTQPLTREIVANIIDDIAAAYPTRRSEAELKSMARVWYDTLGDLPADAVLWAKKRAMQEEKFFPKIATIRELALKRVEWDRRNAAERVQAIDDPMLCLGCHTRKRLETRYRPAVGLRGESANDRDYRAWLASADGQWLLLEPVDVYVCACKRIEQYVPTIGVEPPAMPMSNVGMSWWKIRRVDVTVQQALTA